MAAAILLVESMYPFDFDNAFVRDLPGDERDDRQPRQVYGAAWSAVRPMPVRAPRLLAWSADMAAELGLDDADMRSEGLVQVLGGNRLLDGMQPFAANYGGHQFGHWAGQLGDGRAISLGEVVAPSGQRWELQLKGAGPTPYSRRADGRAVLRSSIREFICSEAMHHLGVPTTRALSLVASGEMVLRDMFYDGNAQPEPGAIICRAAPSFIRFGSFELPASRGETRLLRQLVEFTIHRDFPWLVDQGSGRDAEWFAQVCERNAVMVAHWMRVGFVHGVINTDNMSVLGLTLDYGPYGWVDNYDPDWTPNTTDAAHRRYRFGRQPDIVRWNLGRLAAALSPLFPDPAPLHAGLQRFDQALGEQTRVMSAAKLGLRVGNDADLELMHGLQQLMVQAEIDMTLWFRALADVDIDAPSLQPLEGAFYDQAKQQEFAPALLDWLRAWAARVQLDDGDPQQRRARMHAVNPRHVPRNYLAQQVIDQAHDGNLEPLHELMTVLQRPYDEQPEHAQFAAKRPEWARHHPGSSMLSCSS